jgi:hypothetical protein
MRYNTEPMLKKQWLWRILALAVVAGGTLLYRSSLCNMLFACGCQSQIAAWMAGVATGAHCNIRDVHAAMHCPWCSNGSWGHNVPTGGILVAQALILAVPMKMSVTSRVILSVIAFFVVGGVIGLLFGVFSHYPVFLGMRIF